ncbi:hypothetical protein Btru_047129 [Bulinus truncatus]|nr:hypothetical protein Btru_047129 [Bulinus truncatus]
MDNFCEPPVVEKHTGDVFETFGLIKEELLMKTKSRIYLAHCKENGAVKKVVKLFSKRKNTTRRFYTEVGIMKKLVHPNIMVFLEAGSFPRHHAMTLPYCGQGALYNLIGKISFHMMERYFLQTVSAVKYLHDMNIVHRDIKLDNILVDDGHRIFLTDFDLSCSVVPGCPTVDKRVGTEQYLAPEMVKSPSGSYNGFKLDIYALGVVLFCLLFEKDVEDREDYLAMVRNYVWVFPVHFYKHILQWMLEEDPDWRWDLPSLISALGKASWLADKVQNFILTLLTLSITVSAVKAESMMMGTPGMAPGLAAASASETQCIQQEMLACLSRPEIMADVMKIMSNPNEISESQVLDNLCSHQQLVAELIFCLERTILECYFTKNFSIDGLPLIENWVDGLQFMCQHKKELFENNCSVSSNEEIKKCTGEISQTIINITKNSTQAEVNNFMCR